MSYTKPKNTTTAKPLTNEEKAAQVARFLAQKREQYITSIAFGMVHNPNHGMTPEGLVDFAVKAGDALLERLFPVTKDTDEK